MGATNMGSMAAKTGGVAGCRHGGDCSVSTWVKGGCRGGGRWCRFD